jgi:peptide/nickel transport system permease protein
MIWYIIRRILYMVPTLFGIILITFVLFNVIGDDPALAKLGKQVSPQRLEDFDIPRGYNKPLIAGSWGKIRAYGDSDFGTSSGPWRMVPGVVHSNKAARIILAAGAEYQIPLAFDLYPNEQFKWEIVYCLSNAPGSGATDVHAKAALCLTNAAGLPQCFALENSSGQQTLSIPFQTGPDTAALKCVFRVEAGSLELKSVRLRRRTAHFFDSQLWFYLNQLAALDFGVSHDNNQRVSAMLRQGILPSLALTVPMFFIELLVSISLALFCAFYRNTIVDRFLVVFSVVLMSVNYLVWIILGQFLLGYKIGLLPVWGFESARYLILPCLIGVISGLGSELRFYRTVMLDEMYKDYVRTALAKGVSRRGILFKHVLKNAMIPILTSVVMAIPFLYTGSLLLESFFGIPGLGRLAYEGVFYSDIDVVRALVFVGAVIFMLANLVTDICYALADPRVRLR